MTTKVPSSAVTGLATVATSGAYSDLTGKPTALPAPSIGKVVGSTDGVTFTNITPASPAGSVNSLVTGSVTLTGTSSLYVPVQMASMGQSITLQAANTLTVGAISHYVDNSKGGYPVGIRDNTGVLLMAVAAGGNAYVNLRDNSTVAGVWSVEGNNLEPGLITIDSTFSSTYTSMVLAPFVALDNNTSIHFAALSSGFAAFVVDNTGKVLTTPVTVSSTANHTPVQAFKISATQAIVFYVDSSAWTSYAVVLTLSGSSPSYSLAVGASASLAASSNVARWGGENFVGAPQIAQLSASLYVCSLAYNANACSVVAISVSGTVVTIGSAATVAASAVQNSTTTYPLTSTTALVLYKSGAAAPYANNAVVISVSGTTCTVNTPVALTGCNSTSTGVPSSCQLVQGTKYLVSDDANSNWVVVSALTISGTTVTAGSALTVEVNGNSLYTADSATRYNPHLWAIGSNTAGLWYLDGSGISRAVVLSESSGAITAGNIAYRTISIGTSGAINFGIIAPQGTTEYLSIQQTGTTSAWKFKARANKISGTTLTEGNSIYLPDTSSDRTAYYFSTNRLSGGDYAIQTGPNSTAISILRSNGDAINYRGSIKIPVFVASTLQALTSNRFTLLIQTQSWAAPATVNQLRLLNIEVAA